MKKLLTTSMALLAAALVSGPTASGQAPAADAADKPVPFSLGKINVSGTVDGYYSFNNNHPASRVNKQHNFDASANQFDLNMAKLRLEMAPDPVGFTMDIGWGTGIDIFSAGEPGNKNIVGAAGVVSNQFMNFVPQAYLSVKPKNWGGLQMDFGKFYTAAGAELTETYANWNYSRSLLFTNGPFFHFGGRVSKPLGSHFTIGAQLVNGWNNVHENNTGKTGGLTAVITTSKFTWAHTYYFGPENSALDASTGQFIKGAGKGFRNFYDTAFTFTPTDKFNAYVNYDYGKNNFGPGAGSADWWTIAFAAKIGINSKLYFAPRWEIYNDKDGFITGTAQKLKEFTATLNWTNSSFMMTKFEYRRDSSDKPYFDRGSAVGVSKNQNTALIGLVFFFK